MTMASRRWEEHWMLAQHSDHSGDPGLLSDLSFNWLRFRNPKAGGLIEDLRSFICHIS